MGIHRCKDIQSLTLTCHISIQKRQSRMRRTNAFVRFIDNVSINPQALTS
jgi:hypothetical protein